jgi:lipopolysaccharide assembly protein A
MLVFIILALLILLFAVIFALQNTIAVTIYFLFWQFHGSLALVLLIALTAGLLISFLAYLPTLLRGHWSGRKLRKQVADLESSLAEYKQRLADTSLKLQDQSSPTESAGSTLLSPNPPSNSGQSEKL